MPAHSYFLDSLSSCKDKSHHTVTYKPSQIGGRVASMSVASASYSPESCKTKPVRNLAMLCAAGLLFGMSLFFLDMPAFAEPSQTTVTPLNDEVSLEKTVIQMNISEENTLPWGVIKGKVDDPAQGYPVIIQFFKSIEEDPVHVAQVNLKGDDSFEYRFRVLSIDEGKVTHFFEGGYYVKIFKVINAPQENMESA